MAEDTRARPQKNGGVKARQQIHLISALLV